MLLLTILLEECKDPDEGRFQGQLELRLGDIIQRTQWVIQMWHIERGVEYDNKRTRMCVIM